MNERFKGRPRVVLKDLARIFSKAKGASEQSDFSGWVSLDLGSRSLSRVSPSGLDRKLARRILGGRQIDLLAGYFNWTLTLERIGLDLLAATPRRLPAS